MDSDTGALCAPPRPTKHDAMPPWISPARARAESTAQGRPPSGAPNTPMTLPTNSKTYVNLNDISLSRFDFLTDIMSEHRTEVADASPFVPFPER